MVLLSDDEALIERLKTTGDVGGAQAHFGEISRHSATSSPHDERPPKRVPDSPGGGQATEPRSIPSPR